MAGKETNFRLFYRNDTGHLFTHASSAPRTFHGIVVHDKAPEPEVSLINV